MYRLPRFRTLATLAVAAAAVMTAPAAQAAMVDHDTLSQGSGSFQFQSGDVYWHHDNGSYSTHLTGTIRLDDANGSCARMRLVYFDDGAELTTKYGGTVCAEDGKAHTYSVDLNPYGSNRTDLVKVSLQKQTATSGWTTVESSYFDADFTTDKIKLTGDGIDLGDDWWGVGGPLGSATVSWTGGEDGAITPRVNGTLYLNNMAGVCARMKIYYWSADNDLLATKYGGQVCSPDNGLHSWTVDLAPFTSTQIDDVYVAMETEGTNGSWNQVDNAAHTASDGAFLDAND